MFYLEKWLFGEWALVGQYHTRRQANLVADDYIRRGWRVRVRSGD